MSYDLFLYPDGPRRLEREAFVSPFDGGEPYAVEGDEVRYRNDDTGVSLGFAWLPGGDGDGFRARPHVHFNLAFYRSSFFALEARNVLSAVVNLFSLEVFDPQGAMPPGPFDEDAFVAAWGEANAGFVRLKLTLGARPPLSLPGALNEAYWLWNYFVAENSEDFQREEGIEVYVPRIRFCREGPVVRSFALYPNLIPTDVPKVDYVLVLRNELPGNRGRETPAWVRWEELVAVATGYEVRTGSAGEDHPHLVLASESYKDSEGAPPDLTEWVIGLPDWPGRPDVVGAEEILDAEMLGE